MGASVTENAVTVAGYAVDAHSKSLITLAASGNEIIFYYTIEHYAITYDLNGGNHPGLPNSYTIADLPLAIADPTIAGYRFLSWGITCENGTQIKSFTGDIPVGTTGDLVLTALWDFTPIQYNIAYVLNGGTVAAGNPTTYNVENRFYINPANLNTPIMAGYTFSNWLIRYGSGLPEPLPSGGIPIAYLGDVTIFANWAGITIYSITYELDGGTNGSGNPDAYTVESTFPMVITDPIKDGYTFLYWTVICSSNGAQFVLPATGIPYGLTEDLKLVANWV
jgi:hypothetical protein